MDHERAAGDVLIVYMVTDVENRRISAFVVERGARAVHAAEIDKLGMRGSDTSEVLFEDCRFRQKTPSPRRARPRSR